MCTPVNKSVADGRNRGGKCTDPALPLTSMRRQKCEENRAVA
ncbi:hypothetical protein ACFONI_10185 [Aeromonas media]